MTPDPLFRRDQLERYGRQILLDEVGIEGQRALLDSHALVIGAGGLGAPVLTYLAAAGVGRITLLDPDVVEPSNLHRQVLFGHADVGRPKVEATAERLAALAPDLELVAHRAAFDRGNALELVGAADLVIDGSDTFPSRYLTNDACVLAGRPLVYGAVSRFDGRVGVFHGVLPGGDRGPCYRCLFPEPPEPGTVPTCAEAGVLGALPGAIGALMAGEAIKLITGAGTPLVGALMHLDLLRGESRRFETPRDPSCVVCGDAPTVTELQDYVAFCGLA